MNETMKDIVAVAVQNAATAIEPHVERMVTEHADLVDKVVALDKFLNTPEMVATVSAVERALMGAQLAGMAAYAGSLFHRIITALKPA